MDFKQLVNEFYSQNINIDENKNILLKISREENKIVIDLIDFIKKYESFLNLLIFFLNEKLSLKAEVLNEKLKYTTQKSKIIFINLYNDFISKIVLCTNCKLDYTFCDKKQIICTACGHVRHI